MKKIIYISSFLLPLFSVSQEAINGKVIALHSSVGEVITLDEKNKFSLFPEYKDSLYQSAMLILHPDSTYTFLIKPKVGMGKSFERITNKNEIEDIYQKIEAVKPSVENNNISSSYYNPKNRRLSCDKGEEIAANFADTFLLLFFETLQNVIITAMSGGF